MLSLAHTNIDWHRRVFGIALEPSRGLTLCLLSYGETGTTKKKRPKMLERWSSCMQVGSSSALHPQAPLKISKEATMEASLLIANESERLCAHMFACCADP